ncbi:hypothetical protein [Chitinimonas sp.]|uniref:hypothetical protein n=1 Tax=Chitinimonas sp. TaxID=1934313 RepID=UPI0035AFF45E
MTDSPSQPKPCKKCGSPGLPQKAGSRRFWVQCARFGRDGNCNMIGDQADNKKDALLRWNAIN